MFYVSYKKAMCTVLSVLILMSVFVMIPTEKNQVEAASAPTGLKINEYSASAAKISWSKVSGASGYIVYRSTNGSNFSKLKTLNSKYTSYTNTGLVSGSSYWYAVASYQTLNGKTVISSRSSSVKLTATNAATVPIPSNFKAAEYSSSAVKFTWNSVSGVTGYYIYRSTDGKNYTKIKEINSASTKTYTNGGLALGKKYYYLIASYNKATNGTIEIGPKLSRPITITTSTAASISAPTDFRVTEYSSNAVKMSWKKVSGVSGYCVYRSTDGKNYTKIKNISSASTTTYTNGNLTSGKKYYYKIASYKKASNGTMAIGPKSGTTASLTTTSTAVTFKETASTEKTIKLVWNKVNNASGYELLRLNNSKNTYSKIYTASASTTSYIDQNLTADTDYCYKIRAYYKTGNSTSYSPYSSISVKTNPKGFSELSVYSVSYSSVTIRWTAVSGAKGYQIYKKASNGTYELCETVSSKVTSHTEGFLNPSTKYTFRVRAYYANGTTITYGNYAVITVTTSAESNREINMANDIFSLINAERKKAGIRLLQENSDIEKVAQLRAVEISQLFSEKRPNGKTWDTALDDAKIYKWRYIGELRSFGFLNSSSVVSDWMSDSSTKNQILDEKVTELGVGVHYKGSTPYYVAFFYRPID